MKILIANRGEIACRIIRACKEMGIATVAVYSDADKTALHVSIADESVHIGSPPAGESYLNHNKILNAAKATGATAIHPGYGFLSENADFCRKVNDAGLIFIGPNPEAMELLGSKVKARKTMIEAGVPVIPGMKGSSDNLTEFKGTADEIGYPVLIKASAGGGGKGMRVVNDKSELEDAIASSKREAMSAFGDDTVFLEKYIAVSRHIEIQVAGDKYGNYLHFYERECSIQRRHQKIIEETPSLALDDDLRQQMGQAAIKAVKAVGYDSVATVEFLLDVGGNFYFLEVNTRIQVEHPITEMVTGVDLVKLQIEIAQGKKFELKQRDISQRGHAIECRIYAEDGGNNFMPSTGKILYHRMPQGSGVRYDSGVKQGDKVSVYYDPIMAKLITHGQTRDEARKRMILALIEHAVLGVKTSTNFMLNTLEHKEFIAGNTFTNFIEKNNESLGGNTDKFENEAMFLASVFENSKNHGSKLVNESSMQSIWEQIGNWEIAGQ